MNDKRNNPTENSPTFTFQNDIAALSKAFSIPKIDYVDISRQEHMNEVIRRWPLLAELM
ncbi:MAG: YhjR family protein, partial [Enterobacterales bacterium]|nr:YhjR family protein [Enterobacterales bacterium]